MQQNSSNNLKYFDIMEKKKYSKPELRTLKINPSEMCAGSVCTTIDISVIEGSRKDITHVVTKEDEGSWDENF